MKMDCEIIQDLIPSYVDEICSEATRECVEEHIAECECCKSIVALYRENELTGKRTEQRQIDAFKKLKAKMKRQNVISLGLLLVVACLGVYVFGSNNLELELEVIYVLLGGSLLATLGLGKGKEQLEKATKKEWILVLGSIVAIIYPISMFSWIFQLALQERYPFGMEASDLGPFIHGQWGILFLIQLIILEELLRSYLKKKRNCRWMMSVSLTGMFLLLGHAYFLGHATSADVFLAANIGLAVTIITLGVLGVAMHVILHFFKVGKTNKL